VGLVDQWGAGPALAATWAVLIAVGLGVRAWAGWGRAWLDPRWVRAPGAGAAGGIEPVLAGQPWGVVYGFGLWGAKLAQAAGLFDPTANAFWSQAGNLQRLSQTLLLDVTSITNIGILGGALWVAAGSAASPPSR
jgi:hypothetical protein